MADRRLLGHVLRNLLLNAFEALNGEGGTVRVACARQGAQVETAVSNPGPVPLDIQRQMFRRYVSTKGPDRGLGAYVARILAARYLGGRVSFASAGGNTKFVLRLPAEG